MSNDKIRVGIIGIGLWSIVKHVPNLRKTGKAEVVAISRRNAKALAQIKEVFQIEEAYTDWRDLLSQSQLDAVVVSTAHHAHAEPTIAALERGLHVLVEKPMALTSADAWAMVNAAEKANRVLMVGYNTRWLGCWRATKQTLEKEIIGPVRQVNLAFSGDLRWVLEGERIPAEIQEMLKAIGAPESFCDDWCLDGYWRRNPMEMGGGMFVDLGTHMVDLTLWLAGSTPAEVMAFYESAGSPVDRFFNLQARLANGILISLTSADVVSGQAQRRLTIFGDRGVLTADWAGGPGSQGKAEDIWIYHDGEREKVKAEVPDITPAAAFIAAVTEGGINLTPGRDGAYAVALMEAAYRSAEEGCIIRVELPDTTHNSASQ